MLGHAPRELSNGQKQRTALARALIGNPEVLLLDDPLRNVDAKLRYEMRLELPNLLRRGSAAVLYVTQDYREAMAIADRIAVLVDGRLEQVAAPEEIYAAPASVAVARLFGDPSINLAEIGRSPSMARCRARSPGRKCAAWSGGRDSRRIGRAGSASGRRIWRSRPSAAMAQFRRAFSRSRRCTRRRCCCCA